MISNKIGEFGVQTLDAVSGLIKTNHYVQALVLLYSAIDTLAWSTRDQGDVTRSDFCAWVSSYMDPEQRLACTAADLYAARCALVHSGAAESRMSREGQAAEIWYATAPKSVPNLQAFAQQKGVNAKVLCVTDLVAAFADGALTFSDDLASDEPRQAQVAKRIERWLGFVPSGRVVEGEPGK